MLNKGVFFPPSQAGLRFLPSIREGGKQHKKPINPVNPVEKNERSFFEFDRTERGRLYAAMYESTRYDLRVG